jgi:antitoxin component YwqK of YwqJK toxin-antitoxin module
MNAECYLCYESDGDDGFISPCFCKGTVRLHSSCYEKLRERCIACPICKHPYPPLMRNGLQVIEATDLFGHRVSYTVNATGQRHGVYESRRMNGDVEFCALYENGVLHGPYRRWFSDNTLQCEIPYENGTIQGLCQFWNIEGLLERSYFCIAGEKHETERCFYSTGELMYEQQFVHGVSHGTYKHYSRSGTQLLEALYENGVLHGSYKEWICEGPLVFSCTYIHGVKHGVCQSWHDSGWPKETAFFDQGEKYGPGVMWYEGADPMPGTFLVGGAFLLDTDGGIDL